MLPHIDPPAHIIRGMVPFWPTVVTLLPPEAWGALETILAVAVCVLSLLQKAQEPHLTRVTVLDAFGYFALTIKATFAMALAWDGVYAGVMGEDPRPIATILLGVILLQQTRTMLLIRRIRLSALRPTLAE